MSLESGRTGRDSHLFLSLVGILKINLTSLNLFFQLYINMTLLFQLIYEKNPPQIIVKKL